MGTSTITIRLDDKLKREASEVAAQHGLDPPSVTSAFYQQMVSTHSIPLTLVPEEPSMESLEAFAEGDDFLVSGKPGRFTNGHDLIEAAMS